MKTQTVSSENFSCKNTCTHSSSCWGSICSTKQAVFSIVVDDPTNSAECRGPISESWLKHWSEFFEPCTFIASSCSDLFSSSVASPSAFWNCWPQSSSSGNKLLYSLWCPPCSRSEIRTTESSTLDSSFGWMQICFMFRNSRKNTKITKMHPAIQKSCII